MSNSDDDSLPCESASAYSRVPTLTYAIENGIVDDVSATTGPKHGHYLVAWLFSWIGISLSGGAFGITVGVFIAIVETNAIEMPMLGCMAGTFIAGVCGAPVAATIATLAWVAGLTRYRYALPLFAGTCTGMISTAPLLLRGPSPSWTQLLILLAGAFGAIGGYWPARLYWHSRASLAPDTADATWHFSLGELFLRFTGASILIACWVFVIRWILSQ